MAKAGRLKRKHDSPRSYKAHRPVHPRPEYHTQDGRADPAGSKGQLKSSRREAMSSDLCIWKSTLAVAVCAGRSLQVADHGGPGQKSEADGVAAVGIGGGGGQRDTGDFPVRSRRAGAKTSPGVKHP